MRLRGLRRGSRSADAAILALVVLCGPDTVLAQSATGAAAGGGNSPVHGEVLARPHAVAGSDGNRHLVYELMLTNATDKTTYYVTEITALDSGTGQPVAIFPTGSVQLLVDPPPAPRRNILHPDELGFLFVHIAVPAQAALPSRTPPPGRHQPDQHQRTTDDRRRRDRGRAIAAGRPRSAAARQRLHRRRRLLRCAAPRSGGDARRAGRVVERPALRHRLGTAR